jgi:hypothetical protein
MIKLSHSLTELIKTCIDVTLLSECFCTIVFVVHHILVAH